MGFFTSLFFFTYIYAFSRRFYPKRLTIAFRLYIFYQYMCSLGIEPTTFCAADAMLYHWATGRLICLYCKYFVYFFASGVFLKLVSYLDPHTPGFVLIWSISTESIPWAHLEWIVVMGSVFEYVCIFSPLLDRCSGFIIIGVIWVEEWRTWRGTDLTSFRI